METFFFGAARALNLLLFRSMKFLVHFLMIISPGLVFADGAANGICEAELSAPGARAVRVLRLALKLGELTPQQVSSFAASREWFDPFTLLEKDVGRLALRSSFALATGGLPQVQRDLVRAEALSLAEEALKSEDQIANAKDKTKFVISHKTEHKLLDENHKLIFKTFEIETVLGRPMVVMKLSFEPHPHSQEFRTFLFDLFNPQSPLLVRELENSTDVDSLEDFGFYAGSGGARVVLLKSGQIYSIDRGTYADLPGYTQDFVRTHKIAQTILGPKAFVATRKNHLDVYDLGSPDWHPRKIALPSPCSPTRKNESYLLCEGGGVFMLIDVNQESIVGQININSTSTSPWSDSLFYEDQGRAYLVAKSFKQTDPAIHVYDFTDGSHRMLHGEYDPLKSSHLGVVNVEGVPHLYHFFEDSRLIVHNLRTMEVSELSGFKARQVGESNWHFPIVWRGQTYLFFRDDWGNMQLYNFQTKKIEASFPMYGKVIPIVHDGLIYGIFAAQKGGFTLERLTIEEEK